MRPATPRHPGPALRLVSDRGSLSTYFVMAVIGAIPLVGLVVDGGGQVRAMQQANDISAETARYAGQSIDIGCATLGSEVSVSPSQAKLAAQRFIEHNPADVELSSVTVEGEHTVVVRTRVTYEPIFLGLFGVDSTQIDGEGTAYQYRTDAQGEEYDPDVGAWGRCKAW